MRKIAAVATLAVLLFAAVPAFAGAPGAHQAFSLIEQVIRWISAHVPGKAPKPVILPSCGAGIDPTGACI